MIALDRLADRLMAALPTTSAGTIATTAVLAIGVGALAVHWLGWRVTVELFAACVVGAAVYVLASGWRL